MHEPVLLKETIENLNLKPGKFIIDGTINGGGHSKEILKKISPNGMLLGIDLDQEIVDLTRKELENHGRLLKSKVIIMNGNYADLSQILEKENLGLADGLLLDLGFSSWHIDNSNRGFSFLKDEPLIMSYKNSGKTVKDFLNQASLDEIYQVIKKYGEERYAFRIAKRITEQRKIKTIKTTKDLVNIINQVVPKFYKYQKLHPATKTFQALRIYINNELENLKNVLEDLKKIVKKGGRVLIISFHSLEDRLVKNYFKKMEEDNEIKILTKKPITPTQNEILNNPKSRSAKLRVGLIL
ncbi:MAG: 16S rRNA (cytosine(1402)-N(4))-methyltransferase RsmH [bacterium]|nr:16S rRNA (cytosine(1402)-N(4))-methyltransferase RsmH [Patescibacteria group bacterium]MDW8279841.1 16S rRNA (cytosine(1402)-N(4))-methyltransferase RsmH [bacterium]